jgi:hypothetical protein
MRCGTLLAAGCPNAMSTIYSVRPARCMNTGTADRLPPIGEDDPLREDSRRTTTGRNKEQERKTLPFSEL